MIPKKRQVVCGQFHRFIYIGIVYISSIVEPDLFAIDDRDDFFVALQETTLNLRFGRKQNETG